MNPTDWQVREEAGNHFYALARPFPSGVPRRPIQISLLKEKVFDDLTWNCRVRRLHPRTSSLILVFGYQDDTHFYYAHLSADGSAKAPVHNGLFIEDGAPPHRDARRSAYSSGHQVASHEDRARSGQRKGRGIRR